SAMATAVSGGNWAFSMSVSAVAARIRVAFVREVSWCKPSYDCSRSDHRSKDSVFVQKLKDRPAGRSTQVVTRPFLTPPDLIFSRLKRRATRGEWTCDTDATSPGVGRCPNT